MSVSHIKFDQSSSIRQNTFDFTIVLRRQELPIAAENREKKIKETKEPVD